MQPKLSRVHSGKANASMGVYLFNTQLLVPILIADAEDPLSSHDFGKDVLPRIIDKYRVFAYNFVDENKKETSYWRDVGTIDAYHEANIDLVSVSPIFNFYDMSWPLHTWQQQYPPAKFVFADPDRTGAAIDSIVSGGSIISGGRVIRSVLGYDVRVNSYSEVGGFDRFQPREYRPALQNPPRDHRPPCEPARGHRDRLRHRSRPRPLFRLRRRGGDCGPRRIHD